MSDLISRQDAINGIGSLFHPVGGSNLDDYEKKFYENGVDDSLQMIEELPSAQPDIDEFLRNKSPKEHREILHWIAFHYYPKDSKEVLQAVSEMIKPDTSGGLDG